MSQYTDIAWCDFTASPWFGCTEVSPGCVNCYAREMTLRRKWAGWGDSSPRVRSKGFWTNVYKWNRPKPDVLAGGSRPRIFTSLMDWLDPQVPIEWLADFLRVVHDCQNLDWLLLTKRPGEFFRLMARATAEFESREDYVAGEWLMQWIGMGKPNPPSNVWFGVTCEDQTRADQRLPILQTIPAKIRWVSAEPLLGPICFQGELNSHSYNWLKKFEGTTRDGRGVDWIVVGGESGGKRRDCGVWGIHNIAAQCQAAGVPVFVKQDCAAQPGRQGRIRDEFWRLKEFPKTN